MYKEPDRYGRNVKRTYCMIIGIAFMATLFLIPGEMANAVRAGWALNNQVVLLTACLALTLISFGVLLIRNEDLKSKKITLMELEASLSRHIAALESVKSALRESERSKSVLLSNIQGMAYRCSDKRSMAYDYVSTGCFDLTGYHQDKLLENRNLSYVDLIPEVHKDSLVKEWETAIAQRRSFKKEYEIIDASGCNKWVLDIGRGIFDDCGTVLALEGIVIDISEEKKRQEEIEYLSRHDLMTGLYKRQFFTKAIEKADQEESSLPLSFLVANLDGTRFINDVFGNAAGDAAIKTLAAIIRECSGAKHIAARTDGDEFTILMPADGRDAASALMGRIKGELSVHNEKYSSLGAHSFDISVSFGYNTKENADESIEEVLATAVEYMRRRKLLNRNSSHSNLLTSIKATLYERSQETQEHAQRLARISKSIAARLDLAQKSIEEIELFAMLHDIGKIGIDDTILKKPGKLTPDEWEEMQKHPEIGYRIAKSSPDLENIAEYILSHHENWDGSGYPRGLSGAEIPLFSRILAIADAYDAMTEDRVYRKALKAEDALAEIASKSGTQFDPEIAEIFIKMEGL